MVTKQRETTLREAGVKPRATITAPTVCNRWVLDVQGLDAFLVSAVQLPVLLRGSTTTFRIHMLNAIDWDPTGEYIDWLQSNEWRPAKLKFLNEVGKVVSQ
jgi:hypothetical protein